MTELHELSACEIADSVRAGTLRAADVLEHHLDRIERFNAELNALIFLDTDRARSTAAAIDAAVAAGRDPGPLAGVPLGIKELEEIEGWPFTRASTYYRDRIGTRTTTMTSRLLAAGAVPVGLTAAPEQGLLFFTTSTLHGTTRNPWDLERTPGGSSGGAGAALVAGLVPLATGSDMGGSIRIPASFCGCVGIKGTFGRIPRGPGYIGLGDLNHYGPLARTVPDLARYIDVAAGYIESDPTSLPAPTVSYERAIAEIDLRGTRVAFFATNGVAPTDPGVVGVLRDALDELVAAAGLDEVQGITLELPNPATEGAPTILALDSNPDEADAMAETMTNLMTRTAGTADFIAAAFAGVEMTIPAAQRAIKNRTINNAQLAAAFERADLLVMATTPFTAFGAEGPVPGVVAGVDTGPTVGAMYTGPFNLSGHPAVSVPAGLLDGLPVGMQIIARRHEDTLALAAAAALERVRPWPKLAPRYAG